MLGLARAWSERQEVGARLRVLAGLAGASHFLFFYFFNFFFGDKEAGKAVKAETRRLKAFEEWLRWQPARDRPFSHPGADQCRCMLLLFDGG